MISKAMLNRKQRIEQNQNQLVGMRPEFAQTLKNCVSFSSKKHFKLTYL
jgi:hypothetical protein